MQIGLNVGLNLKKYVVQVRKYNYLVLTIK